VATTLWDAMAFGDNALTTRGDLLTRSATAAARLALGTSGHVLTSNGTDAAWAALPAPPATGGHTLLGTITTTSGTSQSLTSLGLTTYKFLRLVYVGVGTVSATDHRVDGRTVFAGSAAGAGIRGIVDIDLSNGGFASNLATAGTNASGVSQVYAGDCAITTANTSVAVSTSGSIFNAGSVRVYGVT